MSSSNLVQLGLLTYETYGLQYAPRPPIKTGRENLIVESSITWQYIAKIWYVGALRLCKRPGKVKTYFWLKHDGEIFKSQ